MTTTIRFTAICKSGLEYFNSLADKLFANKVTDHVDIKMNNATHDYTPNALVDFELSFKI